MSNIPFHLRPATESDLGFIWEVRCLTMKRMIEESYGWVDAIQRQYARESLDGQIVTIDGHNAGVLTLADWGDQLHLVWVAVHPTWQRKGLGSALVRHCQRVATTAGKPLTLQVLKNNPASELYTRWGFDITDETDTYKLRMRWLPPARP